MTIIKTYQDLEKLGNDESARMNFVFEAIEEHKGSTAYLDAVDADLYAKGQNATISQYQKLLYDLSGKAIPDNYSANHKCKSGFFRRVIIQSAAVEVGNGVTFQKEGTKEKLGKDLDSVLYRGVKSALSQSVNFGFFNNGHIEMWKLTEFVPLWDEMTNQLRAGIGFWQIDETRPLIVRLCEHDGYTEWKNDGKEKTLLQPKRPYNIIKRTTELEGTIVVPGKEYPALPIVPLWVNTEHQSELAGKREQIDCYDLIKSGFANDLDEASMFYWIITNAGAMKDKDLVKFKEHMKTIHVAALDGDDGAKAESHTMEVPYQSREVYLERLEKDLYRDFMALDTEKIAAGQITATQIQAAYEPLNEKMDELEMCLVDFFHGILYIAGIDDEPSFERSKVSNQRELTDMVLAAADYLDEETVLRKLPFLTADEIDGILQRKHAEEADRYKLMEQDLEDMGNEQPEDSDLLEE